MQVLSICEYLTEGDRKPDHFAPFNLIQAIKGKNLGKRWVPNVRIDGRSITINDGNKNLALKWGGEQLGAQLAHAFAGAKIAVVPIPGHASTTAAAVEAGRVFVMARLCARVLSTKGVDAVPIALLHWTKVMPSAHEEGGSRNPADLVPFYAATIPVAKLEGRTVVLVDDVVTSGARLTAAHTVLTRVASPPYPVAELAFAVARTVHSKGTAFTPLIEPCPRSF